MTDKDKKETRIILALKITFSSNRVGILFATQSNRDDQEDGKTIQRCLHEFCVNKRQIEEEESRTQITRWVPFDFK